MVQKLKNIAMKTLVALGVVMTAWIALSYMEALAHRWEAGYVYSAWNIFEMFLILK